MSARVYPAYNATHYIKCRIINKHIYMRYILLLVVACGVVAYMHMVSVADDARMQVYQCVASSSVEFAGSTREAYDVYVASCL